MFTDGHGNRLDEIAVTPGEEVLLRVHNSAPFGHNFYIGTADELAEPSAQTEAGVGTWNFGSRDIVWSVPDDVSGLMFGCTVPGHLPLMHGSFVLAPPEGDPA